MSVADALSGLLRLRPGQARPHNLLNSRPNWAGRLARGQRPADVPALLASLYSLCGHAHRLCAQMALQAARGESPGNAPEAAQALQRETQREHLRRIALDWPGTLWPAAGTAVGEPPLQSLRSCPALQPGAVDAAAMRHWLQAQLLGMPAAEWLRRWETEAGWWLEWTARGHGWLPAGLRAARAAADWPMAGARPLQVHANAGWLRQLADALRCGSTDSRQPRWQGDCAETGPWTRLHDSGRPLPATPWARLGHRLAELVRLSLPDEPGRCGTGWLAWGALPLAAGEGMAWVEMARGLLLHHVTLEGGAEPRVATYRVLAPTEWNFHAHGAVAAALEAMPPGAGARRRIAALMAAYDPCVRFEVESRPMVLPQWRVEEGSHA